ncbi:MAG: phosphatase PAP2 family protein [Nitrososphaerota archaeon]
MVSSIEEPSKEPSSRAGTTPPVSQSWTRRDTLIVAGLWVLVAAALALLSLAAHRYAEFPGDEGLAILIQKIQFPPLVSFINFSSDANWPAPAGYTALVIIIVLLLARQLSAAIAAVVASFGADLANVAVNSFVARPRPHNVHIHVVANLGLHSFPSGHVTHVITLYGFLLYLTFRFEREHPRWTPLLWGVRIICVYFLIFIGPSRVLEGEHWPSDVLGSYLLASLMLVIAIVLYHLLLRGFSRLREWQDMRQSQPDAA